MRLGKILATQCALAFVIAHSPLVRAADADSEGEARERFNRAVELYNAGDYPSALAELNRAAAVRPSYKLLYAIAQVRFQMNDYVGAVNAYKEYLQSGGKEVDDARRSAVQKEIKRLEQRISALMVTSNVPGCEIFLDESPVGTTPLAAPLQVNSGQHRITLRQPDYVPQSRAVSLAGGLREDLAFIMTPLAQRSNPARPQGSSASASATTGAPPAPPQAAPDASAPKTHSAPVPWIGWVATSVLAVGAGVTGAVALSKNAALADSREQLGTTPSEVSDKNQELRNWAIACDVLLASTVVVGGISLWLTLHRSDSAAASAASLQLGVSPTGVLLKSQF